MDEDIKIRNFDEDLEKCFNEDIRNSWNNIFKSIFGENSIITWLDDKTAQQDFGSDVTVKTKEGRKYSIDVKTRRNYYFQNKNWCLEIKHHYYTDETRTVKAKPSKEGWLYCSTSDYIFFGTLNKGEDKIIEFIGFSLIPFKNDEFKSEYNNKPNGWAITKYNNGNYQLTLNKIVDIDYLKSNANKFWYLKNENGF